MKKKYVTEDDMDLHEKWRHHEHLWIYIFVGMIAMTLVALIFLTAELEEKLEQTNQYLYFQYDFTEDECVEWVPGDPLKFECVEYCHTSERQVMEEVCEDEEIPTYETKWSDPPCYNVTGECFEIIVDFRIETICKPVTETVHWGC